MVRDQSGEAVRPATAAWPVRLLVGGAIAKLALMPFSAAGQPVTAWLDTLASLALVVGLGHILWRLTSRLQRRLLWRVRRRLILSYVFVGVVPIFLIVAFVGLAGALTMLVTGAFMVRSELDDIVADAGSIAATIGSHLTTGAAIDEVLAGYRAGSGATFPVAVAVLDGDVGSAGAAGPWRHAPRPAALPAWIGKAGFTGFVELPDRAPLVARAIRRVDGGRTVVVDVPLGLPVAGRIADATGIEVTGPAFAGSAPEGGAAPAVRVEGDTTGGFASAGGLAWVVFLERTDWGTGDTQAVGLTIRVPPTALYQHLFGSHARIGDVNVGSVFLVLLSVVGALFLVMQGAALVMGFALARSITGSVHELFAGTERVRRGDFTHRIRVASGDQLGDLADSFNAMTASVEGLLAQAAEKKRLEEELRIAREMQMSLLPRDAATIPGLTVAPFSRPAREVGGDYYDVVRLGERRLGVLVADVSGKGTSAAFYMAELKGLVLSLSPIYESPRRLLMEVNRILSASLDEQSFITMTYAVIDLDARTITYARAGHTPFIYLKPGEPAGAQMLVPDGLVLGLRGLEGHFDALIEERRQPIGSGDLAVLFTDGITEAMNEEADMFGEERLSRLLQEHAALGPTALLDRVLQDVEAFVGTADQHDDMTMVLVRVDELPVPRPVPLASAAIA